MVAPTPIASLADLVPQLAAVGAAYKLSASGTLANGNYADTIVLEAGEASLYLFIVNQSASEVMYLNFGAAAGASGAGTIDAYALQPGQQWGPMYSPNPVFQEVHLAANSSGHPFLIWYL